MKINRSGTRSLSFSDSSVFRLVLRRDDTGVVLSSESHIADSILSPQ
jgi:hypothetical protein